MTEIRQQLWEGAIPCIITLYTNDSNQMTRTYEFYKSLPRNSYFPLFYAEILAFFNPHLLVPEWSSRFEWWLEVEGVPLRWNWPIGLLYDVMTAADPQKSGKSDPWRLTIRYRSYPDDYLLPLSSPKTLESHWTNQVKESCYVLHGTAKPIMSLSKADSDSLWKSVEGHEYHQFWSIFTKVIPKSKDLMKRIPTRCYITVSDKVIDLPITPKDEHTGKIQSLGGVLHRLLPDVFPSAKNYILAKPVLHGVVIPPSTPLVEIYYEAAYVDGFLHFAIIPVS